MTRKGSIQRKYWCRKQPILSSILYRLFSIHQNGKPSQKLIAASQPVLWVQDCVRTISHVADFMHSRCDFWLPPMPLCSFMKEACSCIITFMMWKLVRMAVHGSGQCLALADMLHNVLRRNLGWFQWLLLIIRVVLIHGLSSQSGATLGHCIHGPQIILQSARTDAQQSHGCLKSLNHGLLKLSCADWTRVRDLRVLVVIKLGDLLPHVDC